MKKRLWIILGVLFVGGLGSVPLIHLVMKV
jgi:hypothetical protein